MNRTLLALLSAATLTIPFASPANACNTINGTCQDTVNNNYGSTGSGGGAYTNNVSNVTDTIEEQNNTYTTNENDNRFIEGDTFNNDQTYINEEGDTFNNNQDYSTNNAGGNGGNSTNTNSNSANGGEGGNSTNTNSNSANGGSSTNNNSNSGNRQTTNFIDIPEATVAPPVTTSAPSRVGDVVVPLPSIGVSAFGTRDNDVFYGEDRTTTGAQIGFHFPLGTGQSRRAAEQVIARREGANRFQIMQEAVWLRDNGALSQEVHPAHWAALYGSSD